MPYLMMQGRQPQPGTELVQRINWTPGGLGCACESKGMGLFDSGIADWAWPEWGILVFGGYMVLSTVFTTARAGRRIAAIPGERRKRKAAALRARANELTKKK